MFFGSSPAPLPYVPLALLTQVLLSLAVLKEMRQHVSLWSTRMNVPQ